VTAPNTYLCVVRITVDAIDKHGGEVNRLRRLLLQNCTNSGERRPVVRQQHCVVHQAIQRSHGCTVRQQEARVGARSHVHCRQREHHLTPRLAMNTRLNTTSSSSTQGLEKINWTQSSSRETCCHLFNGLGRLRLREAISGESVPHAEDDARHICHRYKRILREVKRSDRPTFPQNRKNVKLWKCSREKEAISQCYDRENKEHTCLINE